jgi:hypothetical protein
MLAAGSPLFGRIAAWDGQVAGFAISVVHEGSWAIRPYCYLETFSSPLISAGGASLAR